MATRGGFFVSEDPRLFDPAFFGMTGLEAENSMQKFFFYDRVLVRVQARGRCQ